MRVVSRNSHFTAPAGTVVIVHGRDVRTWDNVNAVAVALTSQFQDSFICTLDQLFFRQESVTREVRVNLVDQTDKVAADVDCDRREQYRSIVFVNRTQARVVLGTLVVRLRPGCTVSPQLCTCAFAEELNVLIFDQGYAVVRRYVHLEAFT
ncbi:hypothetical protein D3C85_946820 [compost metagenome]